MGTEENNGKAAVITGASSGIGAATARSLHAAGFSVALLARRKDRLDALATELGPGTLALEADVTRRDDLLQAAQRVKTELGGTDVLVNNAGVMLLGPFGPEHDAEYQTMVNVNLLGAITATEVFLDQLRDGGGDLVNMASVAGRTSRPGDAVYAATKWGLIGFSDCLRKEFLPDLRVTVVEPGSVATELPSHITDPGVRQQVEASYAEVSVTAEDIASVVAFAVTRPHGVGLNEITVRPRKQEH